MFFLLGLGTGFYVPALTNIMAAAGFESRFIQWAWLASPVAALLSPLAVGALADHRFSAERVMGWIGMTSAVFLALAFAALDVGLSPWVFVVLFFVAAILAAPQWSLMASLSMAHLREGEREFPLVRLGGTVGWMVAGYAVSFALQADASPVAGYAGAATRFLGGALAFLLPATPPPGTSRSLRVLLGLGAFRLLRERDHAVFFATTTLLSMPLAAFYMWTPRHLADAGAAQPTATMALGQFSEVLGMVLMFSLMRRFRVKTLLLTALVLSAVRYGLFAWSGASGNLAGLTVGISLHGLCYTFFFITAQLFLDRRVPLELRSQAQGLLSLASNGIGMLLGTVAVRLLYDGTVGAESGGWMMFWTVLGVTVAVISVFFALAYVGVKAPRDEAASGQAP